MDKRERRKDSKVRAKKNERNRRRRRNRGLKRIKRTPEEKVLIRSLYRKTPQYKIKHKIRRQSPQQKAHRYSYRKESGLRKEYLDEYRRDPDYRKYQREYKKARRSDPQYQLEKNLSSAIRKSLKGNKKGRKWESLVSWTVEELKQHLESLWTLGMSWDNYGDWHIDHKIPESWWEYTKPEDPEFKQCWALANLQPLWGQDNLAKGNRLSR
jgi:hypothetical protein